MPYPTYRSLDATQRLQRALRRWENEGGSQSDDAPHHPASPYPSVPELTNAELVQLQVRVIALENLVLALLADASSEQLERVREIGASTFPRPGVEHRLTILAAAQMEHLTRRAMRL